MAVPGTLIAHVPAKTRTYAGSPSILRTPTGTLLVTHDLFGPESGFDTTYVYASNDDGATWTPRATLRRQFWSTLFMHEGAVHLLGTSARYGDVVIRRSDDDGITWSEPADERSGLLRRGRYHTAPTPVVVHDGRLWRAMERIDSTGEIEWGRSFRAGMLSADASADILDAGSWTESSVLESEPDLTDPPLVAWLEGNAVVGPDGAIRDLLRVDFPVTSEALVAVVDVSRDGTRVSFDEKTGLRAMPGAISKFTVRYDEPSDRYWSVVNHVSEPHAMRTGLRARNELVLIDSADLESWHIGPTVLAHPDDAVHAFQYPDWVTDGDDILLASRTAFEDDDGGADSFHNSNMITFHRIADFRAHAMEPLTTSEKESML